MSSSGAGCSSSAASSRSSRRRLTRPRRARTPAARLSSRRCRADVFVAALVQDADWATPVRLDDDGFARLGANLRALADIVDEHGLRLVLHPHVTTLVETAEDVERALVHTDVPWCLDTGHLLIGGTDPVAFARDHADRVGHVHLKDVDAALAAQVRSGELSLLAGTQAGMFQPLGAGDVALEDVVDELDRAGYDGWYVLEQDLAIDPSAADVDPAADVRRSMEWLNPASVRGLHG